MKSLITMLVVSALLIGALSSFASAQQSDKPLVFRNVDVFNGSRVIRSTNVLIRNGMIRAVGSEISIPPSAEVVDGKGKTLLPGFFDSHIHLGLMFGEQFLKDALDFGVTTELEMWGSEASISLSKKIINNDLTDIADLRSAGTGITAPKGHPTQMGGPPIPTLATDTDVQTFVDARIAEGGSYIKVIYDHDYPTLSKQQLADIIAAVHRRNKLVIVHVNTQDEARDAIASGADGLVHIFADSSPAPGFAEFAAQHSVFVIPTLSVIEMAAAVPAKPWWQDVAQVSPFITPSMRSALDRKFPPSFAKNRKLAHALAATGALHRTGVAILAGTDAPAPGLAHGLSLHRELELLVLAGLTPLAALSSATSEPARAFGFRDRGRIAPGLRADLLLVNGDPTVDIKATRDIAGIWKLGVLHRRTRPTEKK